MRPQAILFDLYDTLVVTDWPHHAALIAGHLGVPVAAVDDAYERLRHLRDGGRPSDARSVLAAVAEACGVPADDRQMDELAAMEARFLATDVRFYNDSLEVLGELRQRGVKTGVVSNCSPSTRPVVDRLGLNESTDVVVLSCEVGVTKPDPAIFQHALDAIGVAPGASVFVDDRADYLDGARRLGMGTYRIVRDVSHGESVIGGDHPVIRHLTELVPLARP